MSSDNVIFCEWTNLPYNQNKNREMFQFDLDFQDQNCVRANSLIWISHYSDTCAGSAAISSITGSTCQFHGGAEMLHVSTGTTRHHVEDRQLFHASTQKHLV